MTEIKRRETMWAEMKPNVYAGERCDQIKSRWEASSEGDKGDSDTLDVLELAARTFPPGTKVTISEPLCPQCGEHREPICPLPGEGDLFAGPCHNCGFDWDAWVMDEYS